MCLAGVAKPRTLKVARRVDSLLTFAILFSTCTAVIIDRCTCTEIGVRRVSDSTYEQSAKVASDSNTKRTVAICDTGFFDE